MKTSMHVLLESRMWTVSCALPAVQGPAHLQRGEGWQGFRTSDFPGGVGTVVSQVPALPKREPNVDHERQTRQFLHEDLHCSSGGPPSTTGCDPCVSYRMGTVVCPVLPVTVQCAVLWVSGERDSHELLRD